MILRDPGPACGDASLTSRLRPPFDPCAVHVKATPYTLRHSFCSLLLHEGRSVIYVARQLGQGAQLTSETYGHVIDELDDAPRLEAEVAIRRARSLHVPSEGVGT